MKKSQSILLLLFVFFVISCTISPEKKAKNTIKDYMFKTLNDYKSYEPVEYGNIDSLFSDYTMDETYISSTKLYKRNLEIKDSLEKIFDRYKKYEIYPTRDEINLLVVSNWYVNVTYSHIIDSLKENYHSHFIGMGLVHKFRAKNSLGNPFVFMAIYTFTQF